MKKLLVLLACASCSSSSPQFDEEGTGVAHDSGSTACTVPEASAATKDGAGQDAAADASDADAADSAEEGTDPQGVTAPWVLQQCWFGAPAYIAVPFCPTGTAYVECFAGEAAGGLGYCDATPPTCHQDPQSGNWHCPAGTRTLNTGCTLQTDDVIAWPSTYSYGCTNGTKP
jgi:hypothetical protein